MSVLIGGVVSLVAVAAGVVLDLRYCFRSEPIYWALGAIGGAGLTVAIIGCL